MKNKIIVISGATSGIGLSYAKLLTKENKVIILSRDEKSLIKISKQIKCDYIKCDISNFENVQDTINQIEKKYKKIDILINNAGIWLEGKLEDNSYQQIQTIININLIGQIFLTKASIKLLKKSKKALIVNTNSTAGKTTREEISLYNASKWGFEGFVGAMKKELVEYNIKIMTIYPSGVDTNLFKTANSPRDQSKYLKPDIITKITTKNIELYYKTSSLTDELILTHE